MAAQIRVSIDRMSPLTDAQFAMLLSLDTSIAKPAATTATAEVTPQQRHAIESLSSESGDSFDSCLWVWMQVSDSRVRRQVEKEAKLPIGSLDNHLPLAARTFLQIGLIKHSISIKLSYICRKIINY